VSGAEPSDQLGSLSSLRVVRVMQRQQPMSRSAK
jgi:hypothetical protein